MSQHRKLISTATDCPEDDSDYAVQTAQDRLKRKICLRKLLICICILMLIIVVAGGVAVGVLFGANLLQNKKHQNSNLVHSSVVTSTGWSTNTAHAVTSTGYSTRATHTVSTSASRAAHTVTSSITPTPTAAPSGNIVNSNVLNYMDTYYDPCEDFYKYSCGNWRNSHPDAKEWGTFEDLALDNYNKLAGYLSQYVSSHDPDAIKKAKYIYSACTDTDYIDNNYAEAAKNFMINKGGGWENGDLSPYNSWSIDHNLYKDHYLGSFAFFNFGIFPDDMNSSKPVITVTYIATYTCNYRNWDLIHARTTYS